MDFSRILAELRQEREAIEEAILSIERLATHRRGRPAGSVSDVAPRKRGRPKGSKNRTISSAASNMAGGISST